MDVIGWNLVTPPANTWTNNGGTGSWGNAFNWSVTSAAPNLLGTAVIFSAASSPTGIITLDGQQVVGSLQFNNGSGANGMTINSGTVGASLTLDNYQGAALITVTVGSHAINAPMLLNDPTNISVAPGAQLTLGGSVPNGSSSCPTRLTFFQAAARWFSLEHAEQLQRRHDDLGRHAEHRRRRLAGSKPARPGDERHLQRHRHAATPARAFRQRGPRPTAASRLPAARPRRSTPTATACSSSGR